MAMGLWLVGAACGSNHAPDTAHPGVIAPKPTEPEPVGSAGPAASDPNTDTTRLDPKDYPSRKVGKTVTPDERQWTTVEGRKVAVLYGDITAGPNGFFLENAPGSAGTLHTHTNDYHAVGITGSSVQQDGGKLHALPAGTYWFQPGGTAHTNTCPGTSPCVGFRHFNTGKFDAAPAKPGTGAAPDPRAVEKPLSSAKWVPFDDKNPGAGAFAPLWGDMRGGENGMFIKWPAGNSPLWHIHRADYHAVVLQGTLDHHESGTEARDLPVGSYYFQPGGNKHVDLCKGPGDCIVYAYFTGAYDVKPM